METEYREQQAKPLVSAFGSYRLPELKKTRDYKGRQLLVNQIASELEITDKKQIRGIFFTQLTNQELRDCWQEARAWKPNPTALFCKKVRALNRIIKERLKYE